MGVWIFTNGIWGKLLLPARSPSQCCLGLNWVNECGYKKQNVCKYKVVINKKYSLYSLNKLFKNNVFLEVKCYLQYSICMIDRCGNNRLFYSGTLVFKCVLRNFKHKRQCFEKRLHTCLYVCVLHIYLCDQHLWETMYTNFEKGRDYKSKFIYRRRK